MLKRDIGTAKNYLDHREIDTLNRITVMFLDQAEFRALRRQDIRMDDWEFVLDKFLKDTELPVLRGAKKGGEASQSAPFPSVSSVPSVVPLSQFLIPNFSFLIPNRRPWAPLRLPPVPGRSNAGSGPSVIDVLSLFVLSLSGNLTSPGFTRGCP